MVSKIDSVVGDDIHSFEHSTIRDRMIYRSNMSTAAPQAVAETLAETKICQ